MAVESFNILFVQEIEKYPCLYNYNISEYCRKDILEKTWCTVGEKFNMTGPECKEKWRNLRTVFVRSLKPAKSGSAAKKKTYYLEAAMQFALPFIRINESVLSGNFNCSSSDSSFLEESDSFNSGLDKQDSLIVPDVSPIPNIADTPIPPPPKPRQRKRANQGDADVGNNILQYLASKQSKQNNTEEENPRRMFLLSLLPEVELMTFNQMLVFKRKVMDAVDEALAAPTGVHDPENVVVYYSDV